MPCCEVPAPLQERPQSDQAKPSSDRRGDGDANWYRVTLQNANLGHLTRRGSPPAVLASGSPSLITQHIRLQI